MAKNDRDNFSRNTTEILAKRVAYLCSNPDCRSPTVGANEESHKSTSIGVAAHITAASEGGPRYKAELEPEQRSDINNGIWLCSNCATLIDKDSKKFTVELLHEWKGGAETESRLRLSGVLKNSRIEQADIPAYTPILEADLTGEGRSRAPRGMSMKNPAEMRNGQLVIVPGPKPIIHWALNWRYKLMIYNNSKHPAYNLKIESVGKIHFSEMEMPDKINNISPLGFKELKVNFEDWVESDHTVADEIIKPRYPEKFNNNLVLKLTYYDDSGKEHVSYVEFKDGEIINNYKNRHN